MGAVSVRLVLVDPLDLGHYVHTVPACLHLSSCPRIAGLARLARMGSIRRPLRHWRARQSDNAGVSSILWVLDMVAPLSQWLGFLCWSGYLVTRFFCRNLAVGHP